MYTVKMRFLPVRNPLKRQILRQICRYDDNTLLLILTAKTPLTVYGQCATIMLARLKGGANMAKNRTVQVRLTDEENEWLERLAEDYGMDRSRLILYSLEYIRENRPQFVIRPQGKESALAGMTA